MNQLLKLNFAGMEQNNIIVHEYGDGIWWLENFLTPDIQQGMVSYANSLTEQDGKDRFLQHLYKVAETLYGSHDLIHLIATKQIADLDGFFQNYERSYDKAASLHGFSGYHGLEERGKNIFIPTNPEDGNRFDIDGPGIIERRYKGTGTPEHIDHDDNNSLLYATILYVNDNFKGGELCFPERDLIIPPKAGALCVFDASYKLRHRVNTIEEGVRFSMPIFVFDLYQDDTYRKLHK